MEFKNIKLPLVAVDLTGITGKAIILDCSEQIMPVADIQKFGNAEETAALANLFAAAPELLEATQKALDFIQVYGRHRHLADYPENCAHCALIKQMESAIAKAYGKTKD